MGERGENSGGFRAVIQGEDPGTAARRSSHQGGTAGFALGIRNPGRFGSGGGLARSDGSAGAGAGFRLHFDANQILIGNFPPEVAVLAALLKILLEENGTAGIGDENS